MADSKLREILQPMNELRRLTPPADATRRSLARVRESLVQTPKRANRTIPWLIGAGVAAGIAVLITIWRRPVTVAVPALSIAAKAQLSAAEQLERAVAASNSVEGIIQVELSDVVLNEQGNPLGAPLVSKAVIVNDGQVPRVVGASQEVLNTARRGPQLVAIGENPLQVRTLQTPGPAAARSTNFLIPLTWEGVRTMPIPLTWEGAEVRPLNIQSPGQVTRVVSNGADIYHITETQPDGIAPLAPVPQNASVSVDSVTGLIQNITINSLQQGQLHRQQIHYQYDPVQAVAKPTQVERSSRGR